MHMQYIKFGEILSFYSQNIERKQSSDVYQGPLLCHKCAKMCKNPNLDLFNIITYTKFGKMLSFCSQDIEQKRNSDVNQGP